LWVCCVTLVRAALALATCLGLGYVPFAPGTFGSAAGLLVWAVLPQSAAAHGVAIVLIFAAGVWSAGIAEQHFRGTDPGPVVIDEVMGMLVTLFMVPVGWPGAAAGFLLFRIFDVIKPPPANRLEHLRGGMGVMADDFMAAVYANIALRITLALANRVISQLGN
jgi:phosphatidylglycerophosphatase A